MLEPDNNRHCHCGFVDDYGNLPNLEYYPKVGDTITVTYADDESISTARTGNSPKIHRRVLSGKTVWEPTEM